MIRKPAVAGQFYPDSPSQLREVIKGMVDEKATREKVIGLVSPHAGYPYSGGVAGATISRITLEETFIIIGPNHTGQGEPLSITTEGVWETPLGSVVIDSTLAKRILALSDYLKEDPLAHQYEHSIEVQLPLLQYFKPKIKLIPIALSLYDENVYKTIGKDIATAIKESGIGVVVIASSDMTHYESHESAKRKDTKAIEAVLDLDEDKLLRRVAELNISMCGYAPVVSLISASRVLGARSAELVKYQTSGDITGDYSAVVGYAGIIIKEMSSQVRLAQKAVETFVKEDRAPIASITPDMRKKAGVFVSIHKLGALRGCIGTFAPTQNNIAQEIVANAIKSATQDPRFPPVTPNELRDLDYSVDVLNKPEAITDKDQLNPKKYGVIVESKFRRGLLLPDLEGVDTADHQIEICRQKAGIGKDEPIKLYRFKVKRYK